MRRMPSLAYLWPGLPQLWRSGLWWGVVLAAGFAVLLDLLLAASFVWGEWLSPLARQVGWASIGLLWCGSALVSVSFGGRGPGRASSATTRGAVEDLFREALSEYLQGTWFEAETVLGRLLRLAPGDVEARLLWATLLRRTRRYDEALDQLDRLERFRDAARWAREIEAERQQVAEGFAAEPIPAVDTPIDADTSPTTLSRQAA